MTALTGLFRAGSGLVGYVSSVLVLLSLLWSTEISSADIQQSSDSGSLFLQPLLVISCWGACPQAEHLWVPGTSGESGSGRSRVAVERLGGGSHRSLQLGHLGGAPEHPAHSPYRLMERFLMDGLYPLRFEMLLLLRPPHPPASPPTARPFPPGPGTRGR